MLCQRPFANRLGAARKSRGMGILADEEDDLIGWKPTPLFPAPVEQAKSKGALVLSHGNHGFSTAKLKVVNVAIELRFTKKFFVRTGGGDLALIHHDNHVGRKHSR